ncbi:MAG: hypothetical protein ACFB4I_03275 [Cyanophyceae cyanobacterium]
MIQFVPSLCVLSPSPSDFFPFPVPHRTVSPFPVAQRQFPRSAGTIFPVASATSLELIFSGTQQY